LFGKVVDGEMQLSEYGKIVAACWEETPMHFPHVELDAFVVMPDHVHLIVILTDDQVTERGETASEGTACRALTKGQTRTFGKPISGSLPTVIRSLKSAVTKRINELRHTPGAPVWQRGYYERIIRSNRELDAVRRYIEGNPAAWNKGMDNPSELSDS
jgi:REP element-mobilizing transposase RayT